MDRVDELNNRIHSRHFGTNLLEPVFDPRPANTRGGMMPIVSTQKEPTVEYFNYELYDSEKMFADTTKKPPYRGFSSRINEESELRNQFFALQRSEKGVYVPSSNSDLYSVDVPSRNLNQEELKHQHRELFKEEEFSGFDPSAPYDNRRVFNNDTRQDRLSH
tara:strand:+ start:20 stop:505 length:486 start_codon:yes stop_codon:yes gene_type:complete